MSFLAGILLLVAVYYLCGKASELIGQLGLLSIAHATVVGTSAYVYAISTRSGGGAWSGALLAIGLATICGAALVVVSQRVTGSEYSLLTFSWQLIWFAAALNWRPVTGGALGLSSVRAIVPMDEDGALVAHCLIAFCLAAAVHGVWRVASHRPFLRACEVVVRSNELALTIGLPVGRMRLGVGLVYGGILGTMGVLLASYLSIVEPGQFAISTSILILAIGLFGESHNRWIGPMVGAILLVGLPELLRFLGVSVERAGFLQLALSGVIGAIFAMVLLGKDGN